MMIFRQNITNAGTHKSMNKKTKIDARLKERRLTACGNDRVFALLKKPICRDMVKVVYIRIILNNEMFSLVNPHWQTLSEKNTHLTCVKFPMKKLESIL